MLFRSKNAAVLLDFYKILLCTQFQVGKIHHSEECRSNTEFNYMRIVHELYSLNMSALLAYHGVGDVNIGVKGEPR